MAKKFRVVPIATVLKNGTVAKHGDIITKDHVDNFEELFETGFLEEVFENGPSDEDKAAADQKKAEDKAAADQKKAEDKAAADLDKVNASYKKAFDKDAPSDATLEEIKKALTDKTPIADLL